MAHTDPRVDAYIEKAADFAEPILMHIRKLVHDACLEVVETIKWSFPNFVYNKKVLCSMAAFKAHAAFIIWRADMMDDPDKYLSVDNRTSMGHFGELKAISDLPKAASLKKFLQQGMKVIDSGTKKPAKPKTAEKKELEIPDYLVDSLKKNKKAQKVFEEFSYSHKKEYVEWVTEAKTEVTRNKRMATMMGWLEEGKRRNWAYERK